MKKSIQTKQEAVYQEILGKVPEVRLLTDENQSDWDKVIDKAEFKAVQYTPYWITYEEYYQEGKSEEVLPFYLLFYLDKIPIGICPVAIRKVEGQYQCGFYTDNLFPPLLVKDVAPKVIKKIFNKYWDVLNILAKHFAFKELKFTHNYYGPNIKLSGFQRFLCEKGAQTHVIHGSVVDLKLPYEEIKRNLRDSYRSLVNKGRKLYDYRAYDGEEIKREIYAEVQQLHLRMSGRVTRSQSSWDEQYRWISEKKALLNCLYQDDKLVGAALFPYTKDMALYLIGVYDRGLFDQPIAHLLIMEAIRYFQEKGQRVFFLGLRHYKNDFWLKPENKLVANSFFKEGFSTHLSLHVHQKIDLAGENQ